MGSGRNLPRWQRCCTRSVKFLEARARAWREPRPPAHARPARQSLVRRPLRPSRAHSAMAERARAACRARRMFNQTLAMRGQTLDRAERYVFASSSQCPEGAATGGVPVIESLVTAARSTLYCSFCGKSQHEVRKLIAGPNVFICNECVELCADIIKEEDRKNRKAAGPSVMTPSEIKGVLDDYVIGQEQAKRVLSRGGAQPLQAPGARRQGQRRRAAEVEHPADRADRVRQDAAGPDAGAHARCAVHHGRCDHLDRGGLRRRGRREHHPEAAPGGRLQRRARAVAAASSTSTRSTRSAASRKPPRSRGMCRARGCSRRS